MGRGLAAILPAEAAGVSALREVALELIRPNEQQPRKEFSGEGLLALSESIKARGILQPIVVRPLPGGSYELIAGERRWRAARMAGLDQIPAIVRDTEETERLELALIENMAREDLNPVEQARACSALIEDLEMPREEVARRVGRSRAHLTNLVRILDLPDEALDMVAAGDLTEGHGRALLMARDHTVRRDLARRAAADGWSVRETERQAREANDEVAPRRQKARGVTADLAEALAAASDTLSAAIGYEVRVRARGGRYLVEFEVDGPGEAVSLAERLLRRAA
jgi:ParB family chromosome partitioning protein